MEIIEHVGVCFCTNTAWFLTEVSMALAVLYLQIIGKAFL